MRQIFNSILLMMLGLFSWVNVEATTPIYEDIVENKTITRSYKVYDFNAIKTSTVCSISFVQTNNGSSSLQIKGSKELIDKISVKVKDGVLCIDEARRKNVKEQVDIVITAPDLTSISTDGIGIILIDNGLKTKSLDLYTGGVGNIIIKNLDCTDLSAQLDGVGSIELSGKATKASYNLRGVGNIKAVNFKVQDVKAVSEGIGNLVCYASKTIDISLQGMGSISYKGNPTVLSSRKDGWGKIKKI